MTFWRRQKCADKGKESVVARSYGGEKNEQGRVQSIFRGMKLLSLMLEWQLHVVTNLSIFIKYARTGANSNVTYGVTVIMMDQYRNHSSGDVFHGGDYVHIAGEFLHGKPLYFVLYFAMNLNSLFFLSLFFNI